MAFTPEKAVAVLAGLGIDRLDSLQIADAAVIADQRYPQLDPAQPALLLGVHGIEAARKLQETLLQAYPADHRAAWLADQEPRELVLSALDEAAAAKPGHLYVPGLGSAASYQALQEVVARLRAPDGCPWDRALTWSKLRATLLEEAHELLAALDTEQPAKVAEEQGDLLLQIAMQVQIAAEQHLYRYPEVIARIVEKLIRRHPHVFGDVEVSDTDEVLSNWEAIKAAERARNGEKRSPLASIPPGLPALAQADAYLDRMSRLRASQASEAPWAPLAALAPDEGLTDEALGEALFGLVAWARARGVDAESALRRANARFAVQVAAEL